MAESVENILFHMHIEQQDYASAILVIMWS